MERLKFGRFLGIFSCRPLSSAIISVHGFCARPFPCHRYSFSSSLSASKEETNALLDFIRFKFLNSSCNLNFLYFFFCLWVSKGGGKDFTISSFNHSALYLGNIILVLPPLLCTSFTDHSPKP